MGAIVENLRPEPWREKSLMLGRLDMRSKGPEGKMRTLALEMRRILQRSHPRDDSDPKVDVTVFHLSELTLLIVGPFGTQMLLKKDRDVEFFDAITNRIERIKNNDHYANDDELTKSISKVQKYVFNRSIALCYRQMGEEYPGTDLDPAMLSEDQSAVNWKLRKVVQAQKLFNEDRVLQVFSLRLGLITNTTSWKDMKDLRGDEATKMLDLLVTVASLSCVDINMRKTCTDLEQRLSQASAEIPTSIYIKVNITCGDVPIGQGGFGVVYKGTLEGQEVAIKVSHPGPDYLKAINREAAVWKHLDHHNIMPFLGMSRETVDNRICIGIVIPWMEHGTIMNYIERNPEVDRLPLIYQIARGLTYLHSKKLRSVECDLKGQNLYSKETALVHGDLKGKNILVGRKDDGKVQVCITDFGISIWEDYSVIPSQVGNGARGSMRWMAPELYNNEVKLHNGKPKAIYTRATDVYALGMTMYEIVTGSVPFSSISDACVVRAIMKGKRPQRTYENGTIPDHIWSLICQCWNQEPKKRLSAAKVETTISNIPSALHDAAVI